MFKTLKFLFQKLTSSRYIVTGKCLKCGNCCRNITFFIGKHIISDEEEFLRMQKFEKKYKNFEISGRAENGGLLFRCKALNEDGSCSVYNFRSVNCRFYPTINRQFVYDGGTPLDGCGYKFETSKKFDDYLK